MESVELPPIKAATDEDFDIFISSCKNSENWTLGYSEELLSVWEQRVKYFLDFLN
jgi:hypothetical protein